MTTEWRALAACRPVPLEHFYPDEGESATDRARAACERCPVSAECLEHAVAHENYGFWAGTSPRDRRRIRSERKIKLDTPSLPALIVDNGHGTRAGYLRHLRNGEPACRSCRAGNAATVEGNRKVS